MSWVGPLLGLELVIGRKLISPVPENFPVQTGVLNFWFGAFLLQNMPSFLMEVFCKQLRRVPKGSHPAGVPDLRDTVTLHRPCGLGAETLEAQGGSRALRPEPCFSFQELH